MPNPTHPITAYISGISASRRFSRAANESAAHSSTNPTVYTNATANRQATRNHGIRANAPPTALTITGALTSSHTHMTKAMETRSRARASRSSSSPSCTFRQCRAANPAVCKAAIPECCDKVPPVGLEPTSQKRRILSPLRLPIPPRGLCRQICRQNHYVMLVQRSASNRRPQSSTMPSSRPCSLATYESMTPP